MTLRRLLFSVLIACAVTGSPAQAKDVADIVVEQLTAQGFGHIEISRTLLGRTRIVAISGSYRREIIINPRTGEILRDYWVAFEDDDDDDDRAPVILGPTTGSSSGSNSGSNSGSSNSGSDDDYDYDDPDDDEDENDDSEDEDKEDDDSEDDSDDEDDDDD